MKPTVLVYRDEGVGALSLRALMGSLKKLKLLNFFEIREIDAKGIVQSDWEEDCALFIVPGGRDVPYHRALKGKANRRIRSYVEKGGQYLGICAGAYYASSEVIFEKGSAEEVMGVRELAFFPGAAVGTLYNLKPYSYEGHESAYPARVSFNQSEMHLYYNGGCTFKDHEQFDEVKVLATYQDSIANSPAIIECQVSEGVAILSGVHFEMDSRYCRGSGELYDKLNQSERDRESLFEALISRLLVASAAS